jgi:adenine/guanine phosphoribosyltransferase-like PRPP-binding protein
MLAHSTWLAPAIFPERRKQCITKALEVLIPRDKDFDSIACQGTSGCWFASILAYHMHKHLVLVRKDNLDNHATVLVEAATIGNYLIVDDLVETGNTINRIRTEINKVDKAVSVGLYLYELHGSEHEIPTIAAQVLETCGVSLWNI